MLDRPPARAARVARPTTATVARRRRRRAGSSAASASAAAERRRALWRAQKQRRREREHDHEGFAAFRYNDERTDKLVRCGCLQEGDVADADKIARAVERLIDHLDV